MATLGQQVGVDLWTYQSNTGTVSLRHAHDLLVPYLTGGQTWPYDEISDVDPFQEAAQTLARAAQAYPDATSAQILADLSAGQSPGDQLRLSLGYWPD